MCLVGHKDQSIDLNICICRNIRPVRLISEAVMVILFNNEYLVFVVL